MTLVSVIIPSYNYANFISETLDCLIKQHYENWEAIVVDDGSTDKTEELVRKYVQADCRIQYHYQKNKGVSAARNLALHYAKGKYIQFLDADDLLSKGKIKSHVDFLETNQKTDIVFGDTLYFEDDISKTTSFDMPCFSQTLQVGYELILNMISKNIFVIQNPIIRKSALDRIGYFADGIKYLEDWDFWFRCAISNLTFFYLEDNTEFSFVRRHALSSSFNGNMKLAEAWLRKRMTEELKASSFLSSSEKKILVKKNNEELINTFKIILSNTKCFDLKKQTEIYKQLNNPFVFTKSFIKGLNIKRKLFH